MENQRMNIQDVWSAFYDDQVPLAYQLRQRNQELWFRIHSLPESKRYAENESETREILHRHNTVASEILGEGALCVWFVPDYVFHRKSSTFGEFVGNWFCDYEDDSAQITLFAALISWQHRRFDAVLRLVADDVVRYVSWMNLESGEIFAPYDGGADLFLNSEERRDKLHEKYKEWLSKHPQGL